MIRPGGLQACWTEGQGTHLPAVAASRLASVFLCIVCRARDSAPAVGRSRTTNEPSTTAAQPHFDSPAGALFCGWRRPGLYMRRKAAVVQRLAPSQLSLPAR